MLISGFARRLRAAAPAVLALGLYAAAPPPPAFAQAIEAVANGDPITTAEVEDQMRFLRVIRKPASRDAAVEDLIADRLKLKEANRYGLDASDTDLSQTLNRLAKSLNMQPEALATALQRAKASSDSIRNHFRAVAAWNNYVRSRNKALNVSEEDITAALAKDTNRAKQDADFTLQQIVFVVPSGASMATIEQRTREAQALRSRFENCATGMPLARAEPDVRINPPHPRDDN
jgi:peptidyl-prolyl cis-trans isomerase SurA